MSADAAAISSAGTVLSQPPSSTTASIGCAVSCSSTSMAMRLRNIMVVGFMRISPSDIAVNWNGRPPASSTPRLTASISAGMSRWQVV